MIGETEFVGGPGDGQQSTFNYHEPPETLVYHVFDPESLPVSGWPPRIAEKVPYRLMRDSEGQPIRASSGAYRYAWADDGG